MSSRNRSYETLDAVHDAFKEPNLANQIKSVTKFLADNLSSLGFAELLWMAELTNNKLWLRVLKTLGSQDMNELMNNKPGFWIIYDLNDDEKSIFNVLSPLMCKENPGRTIVKHDRAIAGVQYQCACNKCR